MLWLWRMLLLDSVDKLARRANSGSTGSAEHINVSGTRPEITTACSARCLNVVGNNFQLVNRPRTNVLNEEPLVIKRIMFVPLSHSQRAFHSQ